MKKGFVRNRFCISFLVVVLVLGFVGVVSADDDFVDNIVEKYNKNQRVINRLPKLFKGKLFVLECEKVV